MGLKSRANTKNSLKTRPTSVEPLAFIAALGDSRREAECKALLDMMREVSGEVPTMWGSSIIGFGSYHYKYASGREGDWPRTGFSPRKASMTIYCMPGFKNQADLLERLGPHKTSVSCLYIRRLDQVDFSVLRSIVARSLQQMERIYGASS